MPRKGSIYDKMSLDLDLDDEVTRQDLLDCLASGWSAEEIAEELGLDGTADVMRWCEYHDVMPDFAPAPHPKPRPAPKPSHAPKPRPTPPAPKPRRPAPPVTDRTKSALWDEPICALHAAGLNPSQIERIIPLSHRTIRRALERYDEGAKPTTQQQWWADKKAGRERARKYADGQIQRAYERFGSLRLTARALGISEYYVKKAIT